MAESYNIAQIFTAAFGVNQASVFKTVYDQSGLRDLLNGYQGVQVVEEEEEAGRLSHLGTPIIYPITLQGGTYKKFSATGELIEIQMADFELPAVTLSTFRRAKNVSKTRLSAGYGTVKEMYGFDDWQIDINGLCLRDPAHPQAVAALEQSIQLQQYEDLAASIPVLSRLFNDKGIDNIVIEDISFGQIPGRPGVIPFTMRCVSDQPDELL